MKYSLEGRNADKMVTEVGMRCEILLTSEDHLHQVRFVNSTVMV